ncbi:HNH endonuclease [Mangrovimonas aestuarii]|uniref:HNH endonuclease n=1 Tax=Mangrovimonas aestuarii TaxID=3018443 RepID=UPI002378EDC5|nr:HNH endonuclease [Mangrovimonas aestuarii]
MIINLKNEKWKRYILPQWRDNEVYDISSHGRVISYKYKEEGELISLSNIGGYKAFTAIKKNKKNHLVYVHRAVASLFLENEEGKKFVIHKDFDKSNNGVDNLAWANQKELTAHNSSNPLVVEAKAKRKVKRPYTKLSEGKVKLIKRKIFDPNRKTRLRLIAKQFGISEMQLYRIKSGENWSSVTDF